MLKSKKKNPLFNDVTVYYDFHIKIRNLTYISNSDKDFEHRYLKENKKCQLKFNIILHWQNLNFCIFSWHIRPVFNQLRIS